LVGLQELYLAENKIQRVENLEHLKRLETLDLSFNYLEVVENLAGLDSLQELWVNGGHNR
jgi:Leucine-rich repeat (LRR) protein